MSDHDIAAMLGRSVGEVIAQHDAKPPRFKNIARAYMGVWLLTACSYTAWGSKAFTGLTAGNLIAAFIHAPARVSTDIWSPLAVWAVALLLGALWLVVGVAGSRGPREVMQIFWALVRLALVVALLWFEIYLPRGWPLTNLVLRGLYLSFLSASTLELVLLLPGAGGGSRKSNVHGQARTATVRDLRNAGIVR
jgi:hypothetical protein